MSKDEIFTAKLKKLKAGQCFHVDNESERRTVLRLIKLLTNNGIIDLQIVTREDGDKFKVAAI
jgi:hypothetical protein